MQLTTFLVMALAPTMLAFDVAMAAPDSRSTKSPAKTAAAASDEGAIWTAKRIVDPFRNETRCVLETPKVSLDDGYQETKVHLRIDGRSLYVITESSVDLREPDVGLQIDKGKLIKPDGAYLDQQLLYETQIGTVIDQFKNGLAVDVKLRFWPSWPSKGLKTVNFSLIGFTRTFARLPGC
jgi:hypothetical protein